MVSPPPRSPARALIVDDDANMSFMVEAMLEIMGLAADIAGNGRIASEMATPGRYAVILMDIEMPEMDGLDATKAIRAAEDTTPVPIIGMTGHTIDGIRHLGRIAGMDDMITKPFLIATLHAKLRAVCGDALPLDDI